MAEITPARAAELIAEALQHSADSMRDRAKYYGMLPNRADRAPGYAARAAEFQQLHDTLARTLPGSAGLRALAGPAIVCPSPDRGEFDIDATDLAAEALASDLAGTRARDARTFNSAAAAVSQRPDGAYVVTMYPVRETESLALRSVHYPGGQVVRVASVLAEGQPVHEADALQASADVSGELPAPNFYAADGPRYADQRGHDVAWMTAEEREAYGNDQPLTADEIAHEARYGRLGPREAGE